MRSPRAAAAMGLIAGSFVAAAVAAPAVAIPTPTTIPFRCSIAAFGSTFESDGTQSIPITVDAPVTVQAGDDIDVTYTLTGATPANGPFALGNVVTRAVPSINARPTVAGTPVTVGSGTGPASTAANVVAYQQFAAPTPVIVHVPTTGLGAAGPVSLRIDKLVLDVLSGDDGIAESEVTCTPDPAPAAFATVLITPAPPIDVPSGAIGGLGLAALVGLAGLGALMFQARRRRA